MKKDQQQQPKQSNKLSNGDGELKLLVVPQDLAIAWKKDFIATAQSNKSSSSSSTGPQQRSIQLSESIHLIPWPTWETPTDSKNAPSFNPLSAASSWVWSCYQYQVQYVSSLLLAPLRFLYTSPSSESNSSFSWHIRYADLWNVFGISSHCYKQHR